MYNIIKLKTVDSTNEWAKENIEHLSDLDGVIAEEQTSGKGRKTRDWFSPKGGLWLSILIRDFQDGLGALSLLSSVSIADVLEGYDIKVQLKWPNDIMVSSKKLGGILIERINGGFIVGIGLNLNINLLDFPDFLREKVITAREILNSDLKIDGIALKIIKRIEENREELDRVYARYLGLNQDIGRMVEIQSGGEAIRGRVLGIKIDGSINILSNGQEKSFYSGSLIYI